MAVKISREYNLQPSWTLDGSEEFPHMTAKPVPLMELEACAVLLFVLKYLFGINGSTEYASSLEAEKRSHKEGVVRPLWTWPRVLYSSITASHIALRFAFMIGIRGFFRRTCSCILRRSRL